MRRTALPTCLLSICMASATIASNLEPRVAPGVVSGNGYYVPQSNGGSMLDFVDGTYPPGLQEPMNIIVSNDSDPRVLSTELREAWFASLGFSSDCLGQWPNNQHRANLGDGNGQRNQTAMKRWNYGDYNFGSCKETIDGGNHFRYWIQSGPEAPSGALFLAASTEDNLANQHTILPNGYDIGRDEVVGNATKEGGTRAFGYVFTAEASSVSGLLQPGSKGINHGIAIDGNVTILKVSVAQSGLPIQYSGAHMSSSIPYFLGTLATSFMLVLLGSTAYLFI